MMDPLVEMSFVAFLLLGSFLGSLGVKQNFPLSYHHHQRQPLVHQHNPHLLFHSRNQKDFLDEVTTDALTLTHSSGHLRKHLMAEGDSLGEGDGGDRSSRSHPREGWLSPGDFHQVTSPPHLSTKKFSYHRVVEERGGSRPYAAVTLEQDDTGDLRHNSYNHHSHAEDLKEQEEGFEGAVGRTGRHHHHHHHIHHNHNLHHSHHHRRGHDDTERRIRFSSK